MIDEFRTDLMNSLIDLCDKYTKHMKESDGKELTIDDICHQSLYFLPNEELMNIINKNNKKFNEKIIETNDKVIETMNESNRTNCETNDDMNSKYF